VHSRGVLELWLSLDLAERERAEQRRLVDEMGFVLSRGAAAALFAGGWRARPSVRACGVQTMSAEVPPPAPPPLPSPSPPPCGALLAPRTPLALPARAPPRHADVPFEMRALMSVFSFGSRRQGAPRVLSLGQGRRLVLQLLVDKAAFDRAVAPLQGGQRVSFAQFAVEFFGHKFGLARIRDSRCCELVGVLRAHAHCGAAAGSSAGESAVAGAVGAPPPTPPSPFSLSQRGGGRADLIMRLGDLVVGASLTRPDGRPLLGQLG
jgi:hypothetical protein